MKILLSIGTLVFFACNAASSQIIMEKSQAEAYLLRRDEFLLKEDFFSSKKVEIKNPYGISLFFNLRFRCQNCPWGNFQIAPNSILTFDLENSDSFEISIGTTGFEPLKYKLEGGSKFYFVQRDNGRWDIYKLNNSRP